MQWISTFSTSLSRRWVAVATGWVVAVAASSALAAPTTLIDDDFSDGAVGPIPAAANWVNSSGPAEVGAGTGFATARALATTYDHDNNAGTANINIPGGLEVNVSAVSTQTITVTMPVSFDAAPSNLANLSFWAAVRANNATGASVSIVDTTDAVTVLPATTPTFAATNTNWQFNSFTFPLLGSYAGDNFNVVFNGGGSNGVNGLELTDITFAVNVPEPMGLGFVALSALVLGRRRKASSGWHRSRYAGRIKGVGNVSAAHLHAPGARIIRAASTTAS
jgi:hypothetical protein